MSLPLHPAREMLVDPDGVNLRVRIARNLATDQGWGASMVASTMAHVMAVAGLYAGAWWWWADRGEWQVIPPQQGMNSAASIERQLVAITPPRVEEEESLQDTVEISAAAEVQEVIRKVEPVELAPREIDVTPVGELPRVAAKQVEAAAHEMKAPSVKVAITSRRLPAQRVAEATAAEATRLARQQRSPAPSTAAAVTADALANQASAASVASDASRGAQSLPSPTYSPPPVYPPPLIAARIEGLVKLRVQLSATGRVLDATVQKSSGHDALDRSALDVIRRWRFTAAGDEAPKDRMVIVPIRFKIVE